MNEWVRVYRDDIKDVPIGARIRINGIENVLTYHYPSPDDYGFNTDKNIAGGNHDTFGGSRWNRDYIVEVHRDEYAYITTYSSEM